MKLTLALLFLSLSAFAQSYNVNLTWTNGTSACPSGLTTNLYRATVAGGQTTPIKTGITGTTYADGTTTDSSTYFYRVTNNCASYATPESVKGNEITVVVPAGKTPGSPAAPTGLSGTSTVLGAQLQWNAVPNVTAYHVFTSSPNKRQWHIETTTASTSFLDKNAKTSGQTYKWFVSAANSQGESDPSLVAVVTPK